MEHYFVEEDLRPTLEPESVYIELESMFVINESYRGKCKSVAYNLPLHHPRSIAPKNDLFIGVSLAILSSLCYASNVVFGKYALARNESLTAFDVNIMRGIVSVIIVSFQVRCNRLSLTNFSSTAVLFLLLCNVVSLCRSYPTVIAYQYISSTKCLLIINVSPVVIVIMGGLLLNEKVNNYNYAAAIIACVGCCILTLSNSEDSVPGSNETLGYSFSVIACIARSGAAILIRVLSQMTNYLAFPFYYSCTLLITGCLVWMLCEDQVHILSYTVTDTILLTCASFGTTLGMITMSLALKHLPASQVAPLSNLEALFACIADLTLFGYTFYMMDMIGAVFIISSLLFDYFMRRVKK